MTQQYTGFGEVKEVPLWLVALLESLEPSRLYRHLWEREWGALTLSGLNTCGSPGGDCLNAPFRSRAYSCTSRAMVQCWFTTVARHATFCGPVSALRKAHVTSAQMHSTERDLPGSLDFIAQGACEGAMWDGLNKGGGAVGSSQVYSSGGTFSDYDAATGTPFGNAFGLLAVAFVALWLIGAAQMLRNISVSKYKGALECPLPFEHQYLNGPRCRWRRRKCRQKRRSGAAQQWGHRARRWSRGTWHCDVVLTYRGGGKRGERGGREGEN